MSDLTLFAGGAEQSPFDAIKQSRIDGREFWSARDLQPFMGYSKWQDFQNAIERAKAAAANAGHDAESMFVQVSKLMDAGNLGPQERIDYELPRFACYLTFLNGDPRKPEVAAAQSYFAIRTREAEVRPALVGEELLAHAVLEAAGTIKRIESERALLEAKVEEDAPKVEYHDTFVAGSDLLSVRTVASTLGVAESWLREELVRRKWIYVEKSSRWSMSKHRIVPQARYSEYSDKKAYFQRVVTHDAPRFRGEVMHTLKITAAGANAIARMVPRWQTGGAA
ncbi:hypothetical protein DW322_08665 [Rhodococcus rhodnii]|uniref:Antirepressor protein C-terminal domain-containing protein n=2 Tax=Rhodococcus rhodnii TaxID=38312 RepID=R7WQT9_9NOCA|nr:phage antirepressor KilAC domain-containing protein [Rhodococcus rhodnii]EOM77655.1 hypothetical protein Rrhod_0974 [Rhodococcus rhodnii LMG 5362]TXG90281.1 hypothetical protein DW322_08665 [Rhodococcus rhodnii]